MGKGNIARAVSSIDERNGESERIESESDGEENRGDDNGCAGRSNITPKSDDGKPGRGGEPGGISGGNTGENGNGNSGGNGDDTGDDTANSSVVNPRDLSGDIYSRDENGNIRLKADGTPAKKRGRQKGWRKNSDSGVRGNIVAPARAKKADTDGNRLRLSVDALTQQFKLLNGSLAFLTKFDDFALEDGEAKDMANATVTVMEQFDIQPDPKAVAILTLIGTAATIYGPRCYLYSQERKKRAEKRKEERAVIADENAASNIANPQYWMM